MKYKLPQTEKQKKKSTKSVMFRIPVDILMQFNSALRKSNMSAQMLVESMVRHCLSEIKEGKENG